MLGQTFDDFEFLIVGDGCTDDTRRVLAPWLNERVRWANLPARSGSQSAPNNAGLAQARGELIAYLGHDDIWTPNHLEELVRVFDGAEKPDFAVSGCIYHTPAGSGFAWVTGFLEAPKSAAENFFPPSSLAHTAEAGRRNGPWCAPETISAPVDAEFQYRAASRGMTFRSTRCVTVHKFAAGHRYLSGLEKTSAEQAGFLEEMQSAEFDRRVECIVERARRSGTFMHLKNGDFATFPKGELFKRNAQNKGYVLPPLRRFGGWMKIRQDDSFRALDWHPPDTATPEVRWSGPNPRPKVLIAVCGSQRVICTLVLCHGDSAVLEDVRIWHDGEALETRLEPAQPGDPPQSRRLRLSILLKPADYTVLEIEQPDDALSRPRDGSQRGVGLGNIELGPTTLRDRLIHRLRRLTRNQSPPASTAPTSVTGPI